MYGYGGVKHVVLSEADSYLPISALEHLLYCERQCGLIHVDGLWIENSHTAAGRHLHEAVDLGEKTMRPGVVTLRSVPVRCDELRLYGIADLVEIRGEHVFPIEYKRGKRSKWIHHEVQLAAQAMSLSEMMGIPILKGAIFYGQSKRRREVAITPELKDQTRLAAARFHEMMISKSVPRAIMTSRCDECSLRGACLPKLTSSHRLLTFAVNEALR